MIFTCSCLLLLYGFELCSSFSYITYAYKQMESIATIGNRYMVSSKSTLQAERDVMHTGYIFNIVFLHSSF